MKPYSDQQNGHTPSARWSWLQPLLLLFTFTLRALQPAQPIVENAVGRQIPTAMVARNLERGSGFLHPILDTGPAPNLFLVEPPLYAQLVAWLRSLVPLPREMLGRLLSAVGFTLAAWGLWGLTTRRANPQSAALAVLILATLPVGLRYGRAFQPDALMTGCWWAALHAWDQACTLPRLPNAKRWLALALGLTACALALKMIWALLLLPVVWCLFTRLPLTERWQTLALLAGSFLPALAWYGYAASALRTAAGSSASADNASIWLSIPAQVLAPATWLEVGRACARAFTLPVVMLACLGLARQIPRDRAVQGLLLAFILTLLSFAPKFHHEYYALVPAPFIAWGVTQGLRALPLPSPCGQWLAAVSLSSFTAFTAWGTFETPSEWRGIEAAGAKIQHATPRDAILIASEALLYYADRPGCRMEWTPAATRRAAGEWRGVDADPLRWKQVSSPTDLIAYYRQHQAAWFADLPRSPQPQEPDPASSLHAFLRERYRVSCEIPVFLVDLNAPGGTDHDQPPTQLQARHRP